MACSYEDCYNLIAYSCRICENLPLFCQNHAQIHMASAGHCQFNDIRDQYQLLWKRELKRRQKAIINQIILEENKMISIIQSASKYTIESIKKNSNNIKNSKEYFLKKEDIMKYLENLSHTFELMKKPINDCLNNKENRRLKIIYENSMKAKEIMFISTLRTLPGADVYICGSCIELGNWNSQRGIRLDWGNNFWSKKVLFQSRDIEFKYFIKTPDGTVIWEIGDNHKVEFYSLLTFLSKFERNLFTNYVIDLSINR